MKTGHVGMTGWTPEVSVNKIENEDIALAEWLEKMATKNENHARKYKRIAAKLRTLGEQE